MSPSWFSDSEERREYEKEYWRHPEVRKCPGCEKAAWEDEAEDASCDIHGDPFEGPFEFEERFFDLCGHYPWDEPEPAKIRTKQTR